MDPQAPRAETRERSPRPERSQPPARRRRDPEGRRREIIEGAGRVIADVGLARLTHRLVAQAAGVPMGSITYYFQDLDELREAALGAVTRSRVEGLEQWRRALAESDSLPETLAALADEYISERENHRATNELYTAASNRPELRPLARTWHDGLTKVLRAHVDPEAARVVAVFLDGVLLHATITDMPLDRRTVAHAIEKLLGASEAGEP